MSGLTNFFLSLSVLFPLIIGLVVFKQVNQNYRPFLVYIFISFASEIISFILSRVFKTNLLWLNLFDLVECVVLVIQFNKWGFLKNNRLLYSALLFAVVLSWVGSNLIFSDITMRNRNFTIGTSFLLVLLSIREINFAMMLSNESILKNSRFIICVGMLLYFTFGIISQTFRLYDRGYSNKFVSFLFSIEAYPNVIAHIIYVIGIYYMPKRLHTGSLYGNGNKGW